MSIKEVRCEIGAEILLSMAANEDLPLPNKSRVAQVMQEYFDNARDEYVDEKSKWYPAKGYWESHMHDICSALRKRHNKVFDYLPHKGKISGGLWKFFNKRECDRKLRMEHNEQGTRHDTHNDKLTDCKTKWKLEIPALPEVPRLMQN